MEQERDKEELFMHSDDKRVYFIAAERLGMIESNISRMANTPGKRKRIVEFNDIAHVLKTLKVIERSTDVVGMGYGCLKTGEAGMFIICTSPTKLLGDVPGEPNTEAPPK